MSREASELLEKALRLPPKARAALAASLSRTAYALGLNFPGYTSEVRYTDRVLKFPTLFRPGMLFPEGVDGIRSPDPLLLYRTATGDPVPVDDRPADD